MKDIECWWWVWVHRKMSEMVWLFDNLLCFRIKMCSFMHLNIWEGVKPKVLQIRICPKNIDSKLYNLFFFLRHCFWLADIFMYLFSLWQESKFKETGVITPEEVGIQWYMCFSVYQLKIVQTWNAFRRVR